MKEECAGACGACGLVLIALAYLAGAVTCLYYSAKAWHDEGSVDALTSDCSTAKDWNKFVTIWSGLICYILFLSGQKAVAKADDLVGIVVCYWLFGVGFGFGTYDNYYDTCHAPDLTQTTKSIEVFMYFWLAVAGSLTAGGGFVACISLVEDGCCKKKTQPPSLPSYAPPASNAANTTAATAATNHA